MFLTRRVGRDDTGADCKPRAGVAERAATRVSVVEAIGHMPDRDVVARVVKPSALCRTVVRETKICENGVVGGIIEATAVPTGLISAKLVIP